MDPIDVKLEVDPREIVGGAPLSIRAEVTNRGDAELNLQLEQSDLLVDGVSTLEWRLAIGNGLGDPRERQLPPGDRIVVRRELGASILKGAGPHRLQLRVLGVDSAPVEVGVAQPR